MESMTDGRVRAPCHACGETADHHPFVKPMSLSVGLVCARCGNVVGPGRRD